ncbi:MAG: siderophore ABC transporter substrate-binding protein [Nitrincola lacisaponensis]|uniref:siderophore ABC transporter substrate-binding protein n=1 Tax=Nitrincola lacisaponensis TaxID=267850 RepID=UPI00391CF22D
MKKSWSKRVAQLLTGSLLLGVWSFAQAFPVILEHAQGETTLNSQPARVAVFDLAALDFLMALEIEVAGVAGASWPDYLEHYSDTGLVSVGTLFEPDFDALAELEPDLIIIGRRTQPAYEALSDIAPTLDLTLENGDFVTGFRRNLALLGEAFAVQSKAEALDAAFVDALAQLQSQVDGSALTLFTVNNNIIINAQSDRYGMLHELTGLPSVAPPAESEVAVRPEPGSPEALALAEQREARLQVALAAEPEWLFILDRGAATGGEGQAEQTLAEHPAVAASAAWQAGRVFYLDPPTWYVATGGYLGTMDTLEQLQLRFAP